MAEFNIALKLVLQYEGGYTDNPYDKGGATNKGITLSTYKKYNPDATKEDLKNITASEVAQIYADMYWQPYNYSLITSQALANKLFVTAVNVSNKVANKFMQKSLNILNYSKEKLLEDGILGTKSIQFLNELSVKNLDGNLLKIYTLLQKEYYSNLVIKNNNQLVFLKGWFNRASGDLNLRD